MKQFERLFEPRSIAVVGVRTTAPRSSSPTSKGSRTDGRCSTSAGGRSLRTAHEMLDELQCRPILDGARGKPALDVEAVAQTLSALSRFAWTHRDVVAEIDINPLFALPDGAVAADALIVGKTN